MALRILVLGSGGREHALAWKLARSEIVAHVYVAPGNGGTATGSSKITNVALDIAKFEHLAAWAVDTRVRGDSR